MHFTLAVQLPKDCECPGNLVSLELLIKSPLLQDHGSVLAQATLHIHSIIYVREMMVIYNVNIGIYNLYPRASIQLIVSYFPVKLSDHTHFL